MEAYACNTRGVPSALTIRNKVTSKQVQREIFKEISQCPNSLKYLFCLFYLVIEFTIPDVDSADDVPWLVGRLGQAVAPPWPALRDGSQEGRAPFVSFVVTFYFTLQKLVLQTVEDQFNSAGVCLNYQFDQGEIRSKLRWVLITCIKLFHIQLHTHTMLL